MYEKSAAKVRIELGASRVLTLVLILVHLGALAILFFMPIAVWLRIACVVPIAWSLYLTLGRHGVRYDKAAVVAIELEDDDRCALFDRAGSSYSGQIVDRWVHPWLTLLTVKVDGRWLATGVVVPSDATAPEPFRRLRVRLRWRTSAG